MIDQFMHLVYNNYQIKPVVSILVSGVAYSFTATALGAAVGTIEALTYVYRKKTQILSDPRKLLIRKQIEKYFPEVRWDYVKFLAKKRAFKVLLPGLIYGIAIGILQKNGIIT